MATLRIVKFISWILVLTIAGVLIAFALANDSEISVNIPFIETTFIAPSFFILFSFLIAGIVLGGFFSFLFKIKSFVNERNSNKKIKALEKEIKNLRDGEEKTIDGSVT